MAEKLKNPRTATVLMAVMIAAAILLGGGRSLRALARDVEDIFWNGADGDGIGVASDIGKNRDDGYNLLSVARNYPLSDGALDALEDAVEHLDRAGRDIESLYQGNAALTRAATTVYEELGLQALSERDETYRQSLYHNILGRNDTMRRDGYNTAAQSFNQKLTRFPANLLHVVTFVTPAPLFR